MTILLSFSSYFIAASQNIAISAEKNNILYIGVDNPISVFVENYPFDQLIIKANKGSITGGYGRIHIYRGIKPGNESIIIYKKEDSKEIGRVSFRVKYIPTPVAKLGNIGSGNISDSVLKSKKYLMAQLEDFDYDVRFSIDSFIVKVINRKGRKLKEAKNMSNKFSSSVLQLLEKVKKGDIVIFKNIYVLSPDGRSIQLSPLVFTVSD